MSSSYIAMSWMDKYLIRSFSVHILMHSKYFLLISLRVFGLHELGYHCTSFTTIELHYLDHVMRQYGLPQHIPQLVDIGDQLHNTNRQGRVNNDWMAIMQLNSRCEMIVQITLLIIRY